MGHSNDSSMVEGVMADWRFGEEISLWVKRLMIASRYIIGPMDIYFLLLQYHCLNGNVRKACD